jgi:hypothetical protein
MEEAPNSGKESPHSALANRMNESVNINGIPAVLTFHALYVTNPFFKFCKILA